jgi:uncharacterized protein involved in exopolysaccharide biosynthesis
VARLEESREGALIQVVDVAKPAEHKSKPKRAVTAVATTLISMLLLTAFVVLRHFWHNSAARPERAAKLARLRSSLR